MNPLHVVEPNDRATLCGAEPGTDFVPLLAAIVVLRPSPDADEERRRAGWRSKLCESCRAETARRDPGEP